MPNKSSPESVAARMAARLNQQAAMKSAARAKALPALELLVNTIRHNEDTGQGGRIVAFLASIYNGVNFPFDLMELRGLDVELADACLAVLDYDRWIEQEVHHWGPIDGEELFGFIERAGLFDAYQARRIGRKLYRAKFPKGHTEADVESYL